MEIMSVTGQRPEPLPSANAARLPAPQLRASEGAVEATALARHAPEPKEEQVQQAARPVEPAPQPQLSSGIPQFSVDKETRQIVARIVDENNEVIRQIPPEELLKVAARIRKLEGILFDEKT